MANNSSRIDQINAATAHLMRTLAQTNGANADIVESLVTRLEHLEDAARVAKTACAKDSYLRAVQETSELYEGISAQFNTSFACGIAWLLANRR